MVYPIDNYPDTQGGLRRLKENNALNHFTATCGQSIFTGDRLPEATGSTPYLSPEESLKTIELQDGYYLELTLSEPNIQEPVMIQFDGNGRMYVVEMRNYMNDADAKDERAGTGVVSLHEDTNGDGKYDKHTTFASNLTLPRKLMVLDKGVVIGETHTHDLKYYEDTDGDGVADKIEPFFKGGRANGNMEHQPNGFVWALDNWWYQTYHGKRYRYDPKEHALVVDDIPGASQWGISQDRYGKVWYLDAGGEGGPQSFQHHILYGKSGRGKGNWRKFSVVYPIDNYPDTQGGLRRLKENNALNHFTATCGQSIFTGDRLPEDLVGDLIFGEPVGRLVRRAKVEMDEMGNVNLSNAYPESEFIRSTDPNFRIINSATAPDGTLYLVDMYRGIIQQGNWTRKGSYLRKVIDAYGLGKNIDRGRIWRLRHKDFKPGKQPKMLDEKPKQLVKHLSHPNGWWRMEAQKLIVLSQDQSVVPALTKLATSSGDNHLERIHALWTIEGLGAMTPELVLKAGQDSHIRV